MIKPIAISLLMMTAALVGCPELKSTAPRGCTKAYDQCTLDSGVLGVCDVATCAQGGTEPCLVCRSQH
jgi:hypothetical protein